MATLALACFGNCSTSLYASLLASTSLLWLWEATLAVASTPLFYKIFQVVIWKYSDALDGCHGSGLLRLAASEGSGDDIAAVWRAGMPARSPDASPSHPTSLLEHVFTSIIKWWTNMRP